MQTSEKYKKQRTSDKIKSAIITAIIVAGVFGFIYSYEIEVQTPAPQKTIVSVESTEETSLEQATSSHQDIYIPEELKNPVEATPVEAIVAAAEVQKAKEVKETAKKQEKTTSEQPKKKKKKKSATPEVQKETTTSKKSSEKKETAKEPEVKKSSSKETSTKKSLASDKPTETKPTTKSSSTKDAADKKKTDAKTSPKSDSKTTKKATA